jgi:hypothetical protein
MSPSRASDNRCYKSPDRCDMSEKLCAQGWDSYWERAHSVRIA